MLQKLSDTVRAIRASKGWTQRAMAEEMGVDFQTVQRAENAGRNLEKQYTFFIKLIRFLPAETLHPSAPEVIEHGRTLLRDSSNRSDGAKVTHNGKKKPLQAKAGSPGAIQARGSKRR